MNEYGCYEDSMLTAAAQEIPLLTELGSFRLEIWRKTLV